MVSVMVGSWKIRRRFMFITCLFCAVVIAFILVADLDTEVAETALTMSFLTLMSVVGSYVFGAAWDDKNARESNVREVTVDPRLK